MRMQQNGSIAWDYFDELVLVAHRPGALVARDFDAYLDDMLAHAELRGAVVRGSDGAPNPNQRERIHRWMEHSERHTAVLTDSVLTRGGVTALRWFGLPIRAFSLGEVRAALAFVDVKPAKFEHAQARLQQVIDAADALARASLA
jgi:hypothetical protein